MGFKKNDLERDINDRRHTEADDDVRSQKSYRSHISTHSAVNEFKPIEVKVPKTIEELENKIEALIRQSMQVLRKQRSNIGLNKWAQIKKTSTLDQDFQQIEAYYSELRTQIESNENYS